MRGNLKGHMEDIIKMRLEGKTFQEIGEKYKVSKQAIEQEIKYSLDISKGRDSSFKNHPLVRYRKENRISQAEMATKLGYSIGSMYAIDSCNNVPGKKSLVPLRKMGISIDEIVDFYIKNNKKRKKK